MTDKKYEIKHRYTGDVVLTVASANLSGANLSGADLSGADLCSADLYGADLRRANLSGANLSGADLCSANLCSADLYGANLCSANLYGANLSGANLSGADLCSANLYGANLYGANLYGADLRRANLSGANLSGADLCSADLCSADLYGANLCSAKIDDLKLHFQICPEHGSFIAWKKTTTGVIKIRIPKDAQRTSSMVGRKCRASHVKVLGGPGCDGVSPTTSNKPLQYCKGAVVHADKFDPDPRVECTHGIHFYMTKAEALEH